MPTVTAPASQRIRDPLHDLIEFSTGDNEFEDILWQVIQTRPFQRLRRIKQLGFSEIVYPGASHSRFAHSIGVFFTARRLMEIIRRNETKVEESKIQIALAAALVHDLGHGPFSHAFEAVGKRLKLKAADHEHVSDKIIRSSEVSEVLKKMGSGFPSDVADMIKGYGKKTIYHAVVSSQFDADRLDYMRRDRLMTGTQHAAIDFSWLMANLEIADVPFGVDENVIGHAKTFVLGPKAIFAAEAFVLGLFQLYPTVYFHKATRGAEKIFAEILVRVVNLVRDGKTKDTGLPASHPLVKFAKFPDSIEIANTLDDSCILGALPLMIEAKDKTISHLSGRLRDRNLYKSIDIRTSVVKIIDPKGSRDSEKLIEIDQKCALIKARIDEWVKANPAEIPDALIDEATRSPYKPQEESKGPLDRINIRTSSGDLVDIQQRSRLIAALQPFNSLRVYVNPDESKARNAIGKIVEGALKK